MIISLHVYETFICSIAGVDHYKVMSLFHDAMALLQGHYSVCQKQRKLRFSPFHRTVICPLAAILFKILNEWLYQVYESTVADPGKACPCPPPRRVQKHKHTHTLRLFILILFYPQLLCFNYQQKSTFILLENLQGPWNVIITDTFLYEIFMLLGSLENMIFNVKWRSDCTD